MDYNMELRSRFQDYFKTRNNQLNSYLKREQKTTDIQTKENVRRIKRFDTLLERRHIECSPRKSALVNKPPPKLTRLEMLQKWKMEKDKKKVAEKKTKKPAFIVGTKSNPGFGTVVPKQPSRNDFVRVTRSQKPIASPPLPLPSRTLKKKPNTEKKRNVFPFTTPCLKKENLKFKTAGQNKENAIKVVSTQKKLTRQNAVDYNKTPTRNKTKPKDDYNLSNIVNLAVPLKNRKTKNNKPVVQSPSSSSDKEVTNTKRKQRKSSRKSSSHNSTNKSKNSLKTKSNSPALSGKAMKSISPKKRRQSRRILSKTSSTTEDESEENLAIPLTSTKKVLRKSRQKSNSSMSTVYSMDSSQPSDSSIIETDVFLSDNENMKRTPENTIKYVSPFVTTSRGKGSVKKENLERSLRGLPSFTEYTTPDKTLNAKLQSSGAAYFHTILDNEIVRLQAVCETWENYKESQEVPVDALDSIDVAVGQAHLLINNKFKQFRGLIVACETEQTDEPVTCEDLQGFWDMVYMQVENLNARFKRLDTMRENNWEEILPQVNAKVAKKRVPHKRNNTVPAASSNIRAAIQAARKKVQQQSKSVSECTNSVTTKPNESVFNGGFFVVRSPTRKTPLKNTPVKKSTPNKNRRSLLVSVLSSEANKTLRSRNSSPGLNMITASQRSKSIENLTQEIVTNNFPILTPGKSILKDPRKKSNYIMNKSVLFKGNLESDDNDDNTAVKTSIDTTFNLITFDSPLASETRRRSSRRSVTMK